MALRIVEQAAHAPANAMDMLETLKANIAATLDQAKAYDLPTVCADLGLRQGEASEAYKSKYYYVLRRVQPLGKEQVIALGKRVLERYPSYYRTTWTKRSSSSSRQPTEKSPQSPDGTSSTT